MTPELAPHDAWGSSQPPAKRLEATQQPAAHPHAQQHAAATQACDSSAQIAQQHDTALAGGPLLALQLQQQQQQQQQLQQYLATAARQQRVLLARQQLRALAAQQQLVPPPPGSAVALGRVGGSKPGSRRRTQQQQQQQQQPAAASGAPAAAAACGAAAARAARTAPAGQQRVLTREMLQQVYHLPAGEAAAAVGLGASQFKVHCRQLGVPRWPYRKRQAILQLLAHMSQQAALPPPTAAGRARAASALAQLRGLLAALDADPNDRSIDAGLNKLRWAFYREHQKSRSSSAAMAAALAAQHAAAAGSGYDAAAAAPAAAAAAAAAGLGGAAALASAGVDAGLHHGAGGLCSGDEDDDLRGLQELLFEGEAGLEPPAAPASASAPTTGMAPPSPSAAAAAASRSALCVPGLRWPLDDDGQEEAAPMHGDGLLGTPQRHTGLSQLLLMSPSGSQLLEGALMPGADAGGVGAGEACDWAELFCSPTAPAQVAVQPPAAAPPALPAQPPGPLSPMQRLLFQQHPACTSTCQL